MQRDDRNRKRCLTQHHGKIAPTLPVADILPSGKEGKGAVMGAYSFGTRPELQALPDAASRQNSPTGNLAFSPAACTLPPINIRVCYAANAVAGIFYEHHVPGERAFYVYAAQGGCGGG